MTMGRPGESHQDVQGRLDAVRRDGGLALTISLGLQLWRPAEVFVES